MSRFQKLASRGFLKPIAVIRIKSGPKILRSFFLHWQCAPLVFVPDVMGGLADWWHNKPKTKDQSPPHLMMPVCRIMERTTGPSQNWLEPWRSRKRAATAWATFPGQQHARDNGGSARHVCCTERSSACQPRVSLWHTSSGAPISLSWSQIFHESQHDNTTAWSPTRCCPTSVSTHVCNDPGRTHDICSAHW